jgi:signal transduction histidine kinase
MHDVLAHRLSLLATFAGAMEYRPDSSPEQMAKAAGVVRSGVHQALDELREVITLLRDDDPDFETRPQPVLADIPRLIDESTAAGGEVLLTDDVRDGAALPAAAARTAYRIVQEGLTNARKHATGRPVRVTVGGSPGTRLDIDIRNSLPPFGTPPSVPGTGTGLVGLAERVHLAGGELDHHKVDGEFRLHAWIPWPM